MSPRRHRSGQVSLSPRLKPIKAVLAKLDPPKPKAALPKIPSAPEARETKQRR
jgi:hypothetical protein